MKREKILALAAVLLASLALSACDSCGDPIRAQSGDHMMACKNNPPSR
jgi:hypothetical protein